ncbi:uncharacterized protein VTP21DRAFT_10714 [Calcarisporiella thermophila]|uniref:uncharacterized protein n=1 Tax=Calcarisporiella thermophila TaxID=911321 RepID=UPI0037440242
MSLSKDLRLFILLFLTSGLFFAEIVGGYATGSLALIADSFHMLNDMMSMIIALVAIKLAAAALRSPEKYRGWERAELVGALINGVFLLALSFSIFLEAIERFFAPREINDPKLVLIIGSIGLSINIIGLFLFHDHSHHHHPHHHHSHDLLPQSDAETTALNAVVDDYKLETSVIEMPSVVNGSTTTCPSTSDSLSCGEDEPHIHHHGLHLHATGHTNVHGHHHHHDDLNMKGVFLHILGDALGNLGVIVTALIIWLTQYPWRFYCDPIISMVIAVIMFSSAIPLVKSATIMLLQYSSIACTGNSQAHSHENSLTPIETSEELRTHVASLEGIIAVRDIQIYTLTDGRTLASVSIQTQAEPGQYESLHEAIDTTLRKRKIDVVIVQPEFVFTNG